MTRTQRRLLAHKQRIAARDNRFRIKNWIFGPKTPYPFTHAERRNMYRSLVASDVEPLMRIADLFASCRDREAAKVARAMDPLPRELVVKEIWDAINREEVA